MEHPWSRALPKAFFPLSTARQGRAKPAVGRFQMEQELGEWGDEAAKGSGVWSLLFPRV